MLTGIAEMANTTTSNAKKAVDKNLNPMITRVAGLVSPYRQYINDAGIAVFALSLCVIPITLLGFLFLKFGAQTKCTGVSCIDDFDDAIGSWLIRLAWLITFIACFLMFLFSGIFTPVSWMMNDSCKMIYQVPTQQGGFCLAAVLFSSSHPPSSYLLSYSVSTYPNSHSHSHSHTHTHPHPTPHTAHTQPSQASTTTSSRRSATSCRAPPAPARVLPPPRLPRPPRCLACPRSASRISRSAASTTRRS